MSSIAHSLRIIRYSTAVAWADLQATYSVFTWTVGWLSRVLMQVVFFTLIGVLLDSPAHIRFLFVGNAALLAAMEALRCVVATTHDRRLGRLPLLVAAPSRLWPVFAGRSLEWLPTGLVTSAVALFALGPVFDVTWTPLRAVAVVGCLVMIAVTTYFVGQVLAAIVLRFMSIRGPLSNLAYMVMMLICGVMVPVSFWPGWLEVVAQAVPFTHGLAAVRVLADAPPGAPVALDVLSACLAAFGTGVVWLALAAFLLDRIGESGRRDGSLDFAS
jgi:ABC-2 type transport system permease protein